MRVRTLGAAAALILWLSACASLPTLPGVDTGPAPASRPSGDEIPAEAIDLGSYALMEPDAVLRRFRGEIGRRYAPGMPLSVAVADQKKNRFSCAAATAAAGGDPPDQVCRRTVRLEGCTHTFQVHLFDQDGDKKLARVRSLYDRTCGGDGLLGGPG
jgi:hypothetical protein